MFREVRSTSGSDQNRWRKFPFKDTLALKRSRFLTVIIHVNRIRRDRRYKRGRFWSRLSHNAPRCYCCGGSIMAAPGCVFHRTLARSRQPPHKVVCRDLLLVAALQRYSRDQGSSVYFPQAVLRGQDLYDVTLTDGDCRLRVTLDPGLNRLVERRVLQAGSSLRNATFGHAMSAQLPEHPGASAAGPSLILLSVEVTGGPEEEARRLRPQPLPWFGSADPGVLVPLRASRSVFLPLWNNVDYSGEQWRETPPTEEEEDEEEGAEARPGVTVAELRDAFLSAHQGVARGAVWRPLIVRIINKSHLMYYGRSERNCSCPYKAVLEVCDRTGSVCVVLWNSVCVQWYRCLKPGDIIRLRGFRVKRRFQAEPEDVEISANSRNPAALISLIPHSSVAPEFLPPPPTYCFLSSKELLDQPPGAVCDVIGLLTFLGRSERTRNKDGHGEELLEYRWMRLEDGTSNQPITVKLLSTSQPETHQQLHPLSVVVCSRVKLIRGADWTELCFYLTNTTYTQVYCTGLGQHSVMNYRKLRPVRQFLQWVRSQEDRPMLSKAVIGGFFTYPPPPISLETYMKDRRGEPGFLRGVELQREMDRLCYRERRTFCVQATVTMVTYSLRGQEDRCLFWTHGSSSLPPPPPSPQLPPLSPASPSSSVSHQLPPPLDRRHRCPSAAVQPEANSSAILFEASMEFLQSTSTDEDEEDEESCVTPPLPPVLTPVAEETLPLRYDHSRREELAGAVALGGRLSGTAGCVLEDYYTLRLRALTDAVLLDAVFLPHSSGSSHQHSNTWSSILSHGAFSSDTPPPSPASQLANQRLVCVLEACHLGGARTELILSRAFRLTDTSSQQHE
eukprot:XP_011615130.1 PREDICTED: uncharacterized protein CXorf57-like [Takifugu rubripes]